MKCSTKIGIYDFKVALQMTRCFGHMFTNVQLLSWKVSGNFSDPRNIQKNKIEDRITHYLNEYCAESLIHIGIDWNNALGELKKPFSKIESINMKGDLPFLENIRMGKVFPNPRKFECTVYTFEL